MKTKLIALDLDGTLLLPDKTLSARARAALDAAAAKGVLIVPATGRMFRALPDFVRTLPYLRYAITINGAQVYDAAEDRVLHRADLALDTALEIYDVMKGLDVAYDCYRDGKAYMERRFLDHLEDYIPNDPPVLTMVRSLRLPVDDLDAMLRADDRPIQKLQCFFADISRRAPLIAMFAERFPTTAVSSSLGGNVEINDGAARKGCALQALCTALGIDIAETVAFGDGINDIDMLRAAGTGVAMANADAAVKAAADTETAANTEDGVAQYIEKYIL